MPRIPRMPLPGWPTLAVLTTMVAQAAVKARWAACVQLALLHAHYAWHGQLEHGPEWRLVLKTLPEQVHGVSPMP